MKRNRIVQFWVPNRRKLAILGIFGVIAYFGSIQSWAFCKDCGVPKPWLYDYLAPIPFWAFWMSSQVPLFGLVSLVALMLGQPAEPPPLHLVPPWAWLAGQGLYYYFVACLIDFLWQRWTHGQRSWWVNALAFGLCMFLVLLMLQLPVYVMAMIFGVIGMYIGHEQSAFIFFVVTNVLTTAGIIWLIVWLRRRNRKKSPAAGATPRAKNTQ